MSRIIRYFDMFIWGVPGVETLLIFKFICPDNCDISGFIRDEL